MEKNTLAEAQKSTLCYHCGDHCLTDTISFQGKNFCCNGCKTVFEILSSNDLCGYYALEEKPGIKVNIKSSKRFEYLDNEKVMEELVDFKDEEISLITFYLPQIHCSACLWLLENLYQLNPGIQQSRVNFLKKEIRINFKHDTISLRNLVELLTSLGYEPSITLDQLDSPVKKKINRRLTYQVGLAGFAFGNIMLLSLPEYFGLDPESYRQFAKWFGWINLLLATPVTIYSGADYFKSAYSSLKRRKLNIDVPIALGVIVLYVRSSYEVISHTGAGYFDSLCGLLFFLLLGRVFQEKIYHRLSFERDYRSYFPVSVTKISNGQESNVPIQDIQKGDQILVRNGELIPVDALLIKGDANIDNSFATGESDPVKIKPGQKLFAGGRQVGEAILLEVLKPLNQSKLTQLWSEYAERAQNKSTFSQMTDSVSEWFTPIILFIALAAGVYHWQFGIGVSIEVMSAVLIVACPCALALAAPFTFGHAMRWLGRSGCYLRESSVIEKLAETSMIVFDKTGTITYGKSQAVRFFGNTIGKNDSLALWNLCNQSNHPLSRIIRGYLEKQPLLEIRNFEEYEGKGMKGEFSEDIYYLGSASWLLNQQPEVIGTCVYFKKNNELLGYFQIENTYREGLSELLNKLSKSFKLSVLSGDNDRQKEALKKLFPTGSSLLFNQSPNQKLSVIKNFQHTHKVIMVGDGLNDAGALQQADVGVVIAEDINAFSPACDIIVGSENFKQLDRFISFSKKCKTIVTLSFLISFLYNSVGLFFAVQGLLSPVVAAILMPLSSISVVLFVSITVWFSHRTELQKTK